VCVKLAGFSTRAVDTPALQGQAKAVQTLLLQPVWKLQEKVGQRVGQPTTYDTHLAVMEEGVLADELQVQLLQHPAQHVQVVRLQSQASSVDGRYGDHASQLLARLKTILKSKPQGAVLASTWAPCSRVPARRTPSWSGKFWKCTVKSPPSNCRIA
jgi:hypothetical protein